MARTLLVVCTILAYGIALAWLADMLLFGGACGSW